MTTITSLPTAPSRSDPSTFSSRSDALLGALDQFVTETNTVASEVTTARDTAVSSASTASSAASTATTQAGTATTKASEASASASSASTFASSAAASYDAFDDRYLGSKAANPTLDNDGNALLTGALYWNSVSNEMRVYSGSAWVAAYVSAGSYLSTSDIGATVQAYDPDLTAWAGKTAPSGAAVGTSDTQTLSNKTFTDASLSAISSSIHSGAIVKSLIYDTSKDSDGGAWRKRCTGKSWYTESINGTWLGQASTAAGAWALSGAVTGAYFQNTTDGKFYTLGASSPTVAETFRGNSREFPEQVAIIAETARVVIYDLTQAGCPMWMVFTAGAFSYSTGNMLLSNSITSVAAVNGYLVIGSSQATDGWLLRVRFISDNADSITSVSISGNYRGNISQRNSALGFVGSSATLIVNKIVNDVAITVLDTAPIDHATGLPVPTIAVATAGGISVIRDSGVVYNITGQASAVGRVFFTADNRLVCNGSYANELAVYPIPTTNIAYTANSGYYYNSGIAGGSNNVKLLGNVSSSFFSNVRLSSGFAIGSNNIGFSVVKENPASATLGMVSYITNTYNTGWLPGDIRGAYLADTTAETITSASPQADRSVKNVPLNVVGTLTKTAVASGAGLVAYSGFSAANYLEKPYNSDLDFGTGDFCVMGWVNQTSITADNAFFAKGVNASTTGFLYFGTVASTGYLQANINGTTVTSATAVPASYWAFVVLTRVSGNLFFYLNGVQVYTAAAAGTVSNASAVSRIGLNTFANASPVAGSLALLRISATAPSADQIAHIYRTELPLFQASAQCTIDGTSTAVTALAYDDVADTLHVGTSWGRSAFRDLLRIDSEATTTGALTSLSANQGAVLTGGASSGRFYQPAMLLRDELRRKDEARKALGRVVVGLDFTATASQTVFVCTKGYDVRFVYVNGLLKRITTDYTVSDDGFQKTVTMTSGVPVSQPVTIMMTRS